MVQLEFAFQNSRQQIKKCSPCLKVNQKSRRPCVLKGYEHIVFCNPTCAERIANQCGIYIIGEHQTGNNLAILQTGEKSKYNS